MFIRHIFNFWNILRPGLATSICRLVFSCEIAATRFFSLANSFLLSRFGRVLTRQNVLGNKEYFLSNASFFMTFKKPLISMT